jgi:hypothetical protein
LGFVAWCEIGYNKEVIARVEVAKTEKSLDAEIVGQVAKVDRLALAFAIKVDECVVFDEFMVAEQSYLKARFVLELRVDNQCIAVEIEHVALR